MSTDAEIAWAAGVFEGEGSIYFADKEKTRGGLIMDSADKDVLERFLEIVGHGNLYELGTSYRQAHYKQLYRWKTSRRSAVEEILVAFKPWLSSRRRDKAQEILDGLASRPDARRWASETVGTHHDAVRRIT